MNNKVKQKNVCIKKKLNIQYKIQAFCIRNVQYTTKPNPANNVEK